MPNVVVEIRITMNELGQVSVTGPLANRAMVYGMLELAKDAVRDYKASAIVIPAGPLKLVQ